MNPAIASELASNNPVLGQKDLATEQRFGMVGFVDFALWRWDGTSGRGEVAFLKETGYTSHLGHIRK